MSRKAMEAKKPVVREQITSIRLDKFLKISRIIKRRSIANDACSTGHVSVNGKEADEDLFKQALQAMFLIRPDSESWTDSLTYDASDTVTIRYQFLEGTEKTLQFYRGGDFNYVIEVQEGMWMSCSYYQFKDLQQALEALL